MSKNILISKNINIQLPTNVGDTVWCTTSDQIDVILEPIECTISQIIIMKGNELKFLIYSKNTDYLPFSDKKLPNHMNERTIYDFGKNVFFEKYQAEEKLKKMD